MGQELPASYQAVKRTVYRPIDSLVENATSPDAVQESVRRGWRLVPPSDRPIARKYLLTVLAKSNATLEAICEGLNDLKDFETRTETLPRIQTFPSDPSPPRLKAM